MLDARKKMVLAFLLVVFLCTGLSAGALVIQSPAGAWNLEGKEKGSIRAKGYKAKDTTYVFDTAYLYQDGSLRTNYIENGSWVQPKRKIICTLTDSDVQNMIDSFEADVGAPIYLDWVKKCKLTARINKKKGRMKAKLKIMAFVSIPALDVYNGKAKLSGKYVGYYGYDLPPSPSSGIGLPEPATVSLLVLGGLLALRRRRRGARGR